MKKIHKKFNINLTVYPGNLTLVISNCPKKINKLLNVTWGETITIARTADIDPWVTIILNPEEKITPGVIAHEALHAMNFYFNRMDIKYDVNNDEHAAYFLGWLIDRILNLYKKCGVNVDW